MPYNCKTAMVALALPLAGGVIGLARSTQAQTFEILHLKDDGSVDAQDPLDLLAGPAPAVGPTSADFDGDGEPYLTLHRGFNLEDPKRFHEWEADAQASDLCITGPVRVVFHAASRAFKEDKAASLVFTLLDRDPATGSDTIRSAGSFVADPLSRTGGFEKKVFSLPAPPVLPSPTVPAGHRIVLRAELAPQLSGSDVWFAYDDLPFPSRMEFPANHCVADDPGFAALTYFDLGADPRCHVRCDLAKS